MEKLGHQELASLGDDVAPLCYLFKGNATPWFCTDFLAECWHEDEGKMRGKCLDKDKEKGEKIRKEERKKKESMRYLS